MEAAVADFLEAAGVDLEDENLWQTPKRVADAWIEDFLDGYTKDPKTDLAECFPVSVASDRELVVVTQIRFHSMCPHHLIPYTGKAHVAYVPGKWVVGFGRLAALVETFAHRLILQEELARQVAVSLKKHLKTTGAACIIEAEQACLRTRGDHQRDAVTHSEAYEGILKTNAALRAELWRRIT